MSTLQSVDEMLHKMEQSDADLEKQYETLRAVARDLADDIDNLRERIEEIEDDQTLAESQIEGVTNRLDTLEERTLERFAEENQDNLSYRLSQLEEDIVETPGASTELELSKLERILVIDDEEPDTVTEERAVTIAEHWHGWSSAMSSSDHDSKISSKEDRLKSHLSVARDEKLSWTQVHRAMVSLADISDGKIELVEHERLGKTLVLKSDEDIAWKTEDIY